MATSKTLYCVIDAGNTRIKLAWFFDNLAQLGRTIVCPDFRALHTAMNAKQKRTAAVLYASVRNDDHTFIAHTPHATILGPTTKLPFINLYKTPKTLGNDRKANIAAAAALFPHRHVLTIDAGTCIKYDFLTATNQYIGGSIHPGLSMRYQAMHTFTGKLPLLKPHTSHTLAAFVGNTTPTGMQVGCEYAAVIEMQHMINAYKKKYPKLITIITGGDARFFNAHLHFDFAIENLTLQGLMAILKHNLNIKATQNI